MLAEESSSGGSKGAQTQHRFVRVQGEKLAKSPCEGCSWLHTYSRASEALFSLYLTPIWEVLSAPRLPPVSPVSSGLRHTGRPQHPHGFRLCQQHRMDRLEMADTKEGYEGHMKDYEGFHFCTPCSTKLLLTDFTRLEIKLPPGSSRELTPAVTGKTSAENQQTFRYRQDLLTCTL